MKEDITTDPMDSKQITNKYYKQFYDHTFDNLNEMNQSLEDTISQKHTRRH